MADIAWIFLIPPLWIAAVVAVSVWYRHSKGKLTFPRAPADAQFAERGCSGRSHRNLMSRIGGASKCVLVVVRNKHLEVTPQFPFNLMFLPEIYGLDLHVPTEAITAITPITTFFRGALRIEFDGAVAPIELVVQDENAFINAMGRQALMRGSREIKSSSSTRKSRNLVVMRAFFAVWGAGALFAAVTGLQQDWRYRREGHIAAATYADPDQQTDGQIKMGMLIYEVAGVRHRVQSLWGVGLYKAGERETVYYLPSDPQDARESGNFHFDLLWLVLGLAACSISIFGGAIARRIW